VLQNLACRSEWVVTAEGCSNKVIGAVMVIGGGIAGMQSALDLADCGYYVYLIEKSLRSEG